VSFVPVVRFDKPVMENAIAVDKNKIVGRACRRFIDNNGLANPASSCRTCRTVSRDARNRRTSSASRPGTIVGDEDLKIRECLQREARKDLFEEVGRLYTATISDTAGSCLGPESLAAPPR